MTMSISKHACVLLLLLFLQCAEASVRSVEGAKMLHLPKDVREGYFAGRSGDIVLRSSGVKNDAAMVLFGKGSKAGVRASASLYDVADTIAWTLGVKPVHTSSEFPVFLDQDPFQLPKFDYVVAVEDVGTEQLAKMPLLKHLSDQHATVELTSLPYPRDPVSLVNSALSGQPPSVHGVVSARYTAGKREVANLADVLATSFKGTSQLLSVSGSRAHALSLAPAEEGAVCYLDDKTLAFKGENVPASLDLNWSLQTGLALLEENKQMHYDKAAGTVAVLLPSGAAVLLPVKEPSVKVLLAEALFAPFAVQRISASHAFRAQLADSSPDLVAFTFTGPAAVRERFGKSSQEFSAALRVLDLTLPVLVGSLGVATGDKADAAGQLLLLGTTFEMESASVARREVSRLPAGVAKIADGSAQSIALTETRSELPAEMLCEDVANSVREADNSILAYCPGLLNRKGHGVVFVETIATTDATAAGGVVRSARTTADATDEEIRKYHIVLWMSILLSSVVFFTSWNFGAMDFEKDNLIFDKPSIKDKKTD